MTAKLYKVGDVVRLKTKEELLASGWTVTEDGKRMQHSDVLSLNLKHYETYAKRLQEIIKIDCDYYYLAEDISYNRDSHFVADEMIAKVVELYESIGHEAKQELQLKKTSENVEQNICPVKAHIKDKNGDRWYIYSYIDADEVENGARGVHGDCLLQLEINIERGRTILVNKHVHSLYTFSGRAFFACKSPKAATITKEDELVSRRNALQKELSAVKELLNISFNRID